jgi:hypothetical protein
VSDISCVHGLSSKGGILDKVIKVRYNSSPLRLEKAYRGNQGGHHVSNRGAGTKCVGRVDETEHALRAVAGHTAVVHDRVTRRVDGDVDWNTRYEPQ